MQSLISISNSTQSERLRYRWTRFLLSRTYWVIKRIVLPVLIILIAIWQIWSAQILQNTYAGVKQSTHDFAAQLPFFKIDAIQFKNATQLQEAQLVELLAVELPTSTLDIDREKLRDQLINLDAVGAASIRFDWMGTMIVDLVPRQPAVIVFDGAQFRTVDEMGRKVEVLPSRDARPNLAVISGKGAEDAVPEAMKLFKLLAPINDDVRGLVRIGERRWDVILTNDRRLELPEDAPVDALYLILSQHQRNGILDREISVFDMRDPGRPIIRLHPDAVERRIADQNQETGQAI